MEKFNILKEIKALDMLILKKMQFDLKKEEGKIPTPTQMHILDYMLKHEDEDIYQKDLENVFNLSRATISSVLQTMEKYCLIARVINSEDTRTKKIILNEETKEFFKLHKKNFEDLENKMLKDISNDDLEIFNKVLKKMQENLY